VLGAVEVVDGVLRLAAKRRQSVARGASPWTMSGNRCLAPKGRQSASAAPPGLNLRFGFFPGAYAPGYWLPSLRDSNTLKANNTMRTARIERKTAETQIELELNLDGSGQAQLASGVGFLDHMLALLAKHAAIDLSVKAVGDLQVDQHHTVEDVGICLGQALRQALGDRAGITRFGHATLPMEESLVTCAVDLGGRPVCAFDAKLPSPKIGEFDSELVADFWQAFATNALCNLHVIVHYGRNSHHIAEAIFKAAARALRMALAPDPRLPGVPSTKGVL
jgi:imidazoleglycerol-phosphate dehydratase